MIYLTTNNAVRLSSGTDANSKINSAIVVTPSIGDYVAVSGIANDQYVGAWVYSTSWNRATLASILDPLIESQAQVSQTISVRTSQFGDGYIRQTPNGFNNIKEEWSLKTQPIRSPMRNLLEAAIIGLYALNSTGVFAWTAPGDYEEKRWLAKDGNWRFESIGNGYYTLTITVSRTYNPV